MTHKVFLNNPDRSQLVVTGDLITEEGIFFITNSDRKVFRVPFANVLYIESI